METFLPSFPNGTPMPAPFDKDIELQQNIGYGRFGQVITTWYGAFAFLK